MLNINIIFIFLLFKYNKSDKNTLNTLQLKYAAKHMFCYLDKGFIVGKSKTSRID